VVGVDEIHPYGGSTDKYVSWAGFRDFHILKRENVRTAGFGNAYGFHQDLDWDRPVKQMAASASGSSPPMGAAQNKTPGYF
jgi:hypothetical protein